MVHTQNLIDLLFPQKVISNEHEPLALSGKLFRQLNAIGKFSNLCRHQQRSDVFDRVLWGMGQDQLPFF